jgi:hypothetical protein
MQQIHSNLKNEFFWTGLPIISVRFQSPLIFRLALLKCRFIRSYLGFKMAAGRMVSGRKSR